MLTLESQLSASFDFFAKRRDEKALRKYCEGMAADQVAVCLAQLERYGLREAQITADRIRAKMAVIRTRYGMRPDPPSAA